MGELNRIPVETKVLDTTLEGTPLVITKFTEFRDGKLQQESLLRNGDKIRLVVTVNELRPEVYAVEIFTGKDKRFFSISSPTWLTFTGLLNGGDASLSVDVDTNELVFKIR